MTKKCINNLFASIAKNIENGTNNKNVLRNRKASVYLTVWTFRALVRAGLPHHLRKTHRDEEFCRTNSTFLGSEKMLSPTSAAEQLQRLCALGRVGTNWRVTPDSCTAPPNVLER